MGTIDGDPTTDNEGNRIDNPTSNGPFSVAQITPPNLEIAPYNQIDPLQQSLAALDKRLNAFEKVFDVTGKLLDRLPGYEFNQNRDYYNQASPFLRNEIGTENAFNQQQLTGQIDRAAPGARNTLQINEGIANNFAQGRFSNDVLNSAFEVNSRGLAAANLNAAGYGDTAYTDDLNDKFSVMQRLNLQQYGIQTGSQLAGQRIGTLTSQPARLAAAEQFSPRLSYSPGQALLGQANTQYANSVVDATNTASMGIQQEQFRTNQVQGVYNTRAAMDMAAQTTNASNGLATQQLNYGAYMNERAIAQSQADRQLANQAAAQGRQDAIDQQNTQAGTALVGAAIQSPWGQSILGSAGDWLREQWDGGSDSGGSAGDVRSPTGTIPGGIGGAPYIPSASETSSNNQDGPSSFEDSLNESTGSDADIAAESTNDSWNQAAGEASQATFNEGANAASNPEPASDSWYRSATTQKSRSATTQQVNSSFSGLNNTALQGGLSYNYARTAGTQFNSGLEKNSQPVDPMVKNALTYFGMGEPKTLDMAQLTSTNGESSKSALITGLSLPGESLSKNLIGKLTANSTAMLNVSKNGEMQIGLDPEKMGINLLTLPISKETGSKASEYGEGITREITRLQSNDWKTNMTEVPKLLNQILKDQNISDPIDANGNSLNAPKESMKWTEEKSPMTQTWYGPMNRTTEDLARGRKTYDWVSKQLGEYGVGVNLQNLDGDEDAKAEMGAIFYDTVKQWKDLTPENRMTSMAQIMVAYKGSLRRSNGNK